MSTPGKGRASAYTGGLLLLLLASASASSAPLFSGSLTWKVHPNFAAGTRVVEFTLDTAFEMDLTAESNCSYVVGQKVLCNPTSDGSSRWGRLCVDQYDHEIDGHRLRVFPESSPSSAPYDSEANCPGADNDFTVDSMHHINGANIVLGRLTHALTMHPKAFAAMAFLSTGRRAADVGVSAGTLLPQCVNMTHPPQVPLFR